jgi:NADH-quinone oxidoreductase subunit N
VIDHVALLPAYCAAGTAVLAFLCDLLAPRRLGPLLAVTLLGALATGLVCWLVYRGGERVTFCALEGFCSYRWDSSAALVGVVVASATMIVLGLSLPALSVPALRSPETSPETSVEAGQSLPAGEYCFLLACAMTGGVVLGASRDLITLVIALETLTLPLYVLVGLRRREVASAEAAVTFFVVSVVSTAVTLLGAALLYGATGTVHFSALPAALRAPDVPLVDAALVLVLVGLAFKVAAVPFHAWAPSTYDGAPLPVAAYLSTASKLGGVISLLYVAVGALGSRLDVVGPLLAVVAVLTMTVGNLVALRQRRMVRLLAWSSVAQAGYILAPLGALALTPSAVDVVVPAVLAYTVFYIVLELTAFGCVVALRGTSDGGMMTDYAGAARARPWV